MQFITRYHFSSSTCLYKVLGVQQKSTQDQIKFAYIQLAKQHHPDVNKSSGVKFKEISNAYTVLKDPIKRNIYDQSQEPNIGQQQSSYSQQKESQGQDKYEQKAYQRQYHKDKDKDQISIYWALMGGMLVYSVYLGFGQKHQIKYSEKDQYKKTLEDQIRKLTIKLQTDGPFTYDQLNNINDLIQKFKDQQYQNNLAQNQSQINIETQKISDIRRKNIFMTNENIDSSPHVMARRKKVLEEEMKQKKFKIEYETWQTVRTGEVSRLQRKTQTQTRKKSKKDDVILEDFAKQHRIRLIKREREAHSPKQLSLDELEESYI